MNKTEATAKSFLTALQSLSREERDEVYVQIAKNGRLFQELQDVSLIESRRDEASRPFREIVKGSA